MIQFRVLSGRSAGALVPAARWPFVIGRNKDADYCLEEEGVWDHHIELTLHPEAGFRVEVRSGASATVNGEPVRSAVLRSGDVIEIGPVKLRFAFSPTRQANLRWRERLAWGALIALCAVQVALVYLLSN